MWMRAGDEISYRPIQISLAIDRIIELRKFGFDPANMTVREIYEASQVTVDIKPKYSIMDSARIKHVVSNNSFGENYND